MEGKHTKGEKKLGSRRNNRPQLPQKSWKAKRNRKRKNRAAKRKLRKNYGRRQRGDKQRRKTTLSNMFIAYKWGAKTGKKGTSRKAEVGKQEQIQKQEDKSE